MAIIALSWCILKTKKYFLHFYTALALSNHHRSVNTTLPTDIGLGWKGWQGTNTQAYKENK
jgi:hypothetical protein